MGTCKLCGRSGVTISDSLGICVDCLRSRPGKALEIAKRAHVVSRSRFRLPAEPPGSGVRCGIAAGGASCLRGASATVDW